MAEYNLAPIAHCAFLKAIDGLGKPFADEARLQISDITFTVTAARQHYSFARC